MNAVGVADLEQLHVESNSGHSQHLKLTLHLQACGQATRTHVARPHVLMLHEAQ